MNKILSEALSVFLYLAAAAIFASILVFLPIVGLLLILGVIIFKKGILVKKITLKGAIFVISTIVIFYAIGISSMIGSPVSAENAKIQSYLDQMKTVFSSHYYVNNGNSYIGTDEENEYINLRGKIEEIYQNKRMKNSYSVQINEKEYCAKAKNISEDYYWCINNKDYVTTTDQYCTAERPYCVEPTVGK